MTEARADFVVFKEPAFLLALLLGCGVLGCIAGVIWYVQT
jgi:hypothetical protein